MMPKPRMIAAGRKNFRIGMPIRKIRTLLRAKNIAANPDPPGIFEMLICGADGSLMVAPPLLSVTESRSSDERVDGRLCDRVIAGPRLRVDPFCAPAAFRRLQQLGIKRFEELPAADRGQELLQLRVRRRIISGNRHLEPLCEDLGVA